jgi:hypothetical protein
MMLSQLLRKDKEAVVYTVENLTPQTIWFAVYRKKVVVRRAVTQSQHCAHCLRNDSLILLLHCAHFAVTASASSAASS